MSCTAVGTGPLSFQWTFNGNNLVDGSHVTPQPGDLSIVSGAQTPTLTITGLSTNETGNFAVTVSTTASVSPNSATSTNALLTVNPPKSVSLAFIRSLVNTSTWQPTDTSTLYAISNVVVTTFTNVTSGNTSSYYVQDATAGLDLFITGDSSFRPQMGDIIRAAGTISSFNNALELAITTQNPYEYYQVTGHTNVLPAPTVFNMSLTNNAGIMETNIEGRIIMLTNVWFTGATETPGGAALIVTNAAGGPLQLFFAGTDEDVVGQPIATNFAWTITGVMSQFKSGSYDNASYQVYITRMGDIVTNEPAPVTVSASRTGSSITLNWVATPYVPDNSQPGAYAYSVYSSPDLNGPYTPLATGLAFGTTNGTYTDTLTSAATKFYKVTSP
jgi:hypothetical protein